MFSVRQTSEDQRKMEQNHAGPSESFRRSSEIQITKRKSSSPTPSSTTMSATRSRSSCVHDRKDSPLSSGSTAGVSRPVKSVGKQEHQSVVRHGTAKLKHKRRKKKITSMNDVNVKGNPDATPTIKTCYRQDHQNGSVLNISESIAPPVITANVQNESSLIGEAEQAPVKVEPLHGTVAETPQTTRSKDTWTVIHQLPLPQLDGFVASFENGFRLKTENNPAKGRMRYYNCTRIKVRAKPQCSRQLLAFIPNTVGPVSVSVKGHHTCHEAPAGTVARTKITKEDLQIIDQLVGSGVPSKHVKLQMQANNSHLAKGSLNYAVKMSQKKIYGNGEMSLGELEAWVVSKSTTPEAAEQGYVIGQDIDRDNGKFRIVLSSKRMLSLLPRFRTIAADCTFKTTLQGYPLLVVCVIDEMRKAHPVAFACVTHQEHIDYEFVFRSLLTAASQHGDVNICNFLSDGEAALKNAARTVFGQSVALLNCYFHVKQNLIKHFKKSKELSADIQNQVLREVTLLQIAPTKPHFAAALELFIAKYSQYEAFSLFFDKYARNEKFALWHEAAQPGVPSTNNAIEAINKSIKHNHLKRHKEPFSTFKVQLMNIIQAYSNPERVIALDRSIALADEREAFDFLKSSKKKSYNQQK
nr:uncharacterized protein LOC109417423 [Aedes albopictus]